MCVYVDEIEDVSDYVKNVCTFLSGFYSLSLSPSLSSLLFSYLFDRQKNPPKVLFFVVPASSALLLVHKDIFLLKVNRTYTSDEHFAVPISFRRLNSLIYVAMDIKFEIASFNCIESRCSMLVF